MKFALIAAVGLLAGCATTQSATTQPASNVPMHSEAKVDSAGAQKSFDHPPKPGEKAICPVSGDAFIVDASTQTAQHDGRYYAFCCDGCVGDFNGNPSKYTQ